MEFKFSNHALEEMQRRKIPIELVEHTIENPQQILKQDEEISIYQSQIDFGAGKLFLLRVFIATRINPTTIVTVYRTSQTKKYWRNS